MRGLSRISREARGEKEVLPVISTRILCSEQNIARVTITLVVNGSTGWFYIYIYFENSKGSYLDRNWERNET